LDNAGLVFSGIFFVEGVFMFLFNSFHTGNRKASKSPASGSHRRHWARGVFVSALMFCLSTALLVTGCDMDGGGGGSIAPVEDTLEANLIGTWSSPYDDGYVITANKITYDDGGYGSGYTGTIQYVSNFTNSAGVIIIKYDDGKKPSYWDYDDDWNPTIELPLKGDFIGVYYKDLRPGVSVLMGGAYIYGGAEEATLDAAKKAFTAGNEGKYMTHYGEYSK
jgi:hypothetical protein